MNNGKPGQFTVTLPSGHTAKWVEWQLDGAAWKRVDAAGQTSVTIDTGLRSIARVSGDHTLNVRTANDSGSSDPVTVRFTGDGTSGSGPKADITLDAPDESVKQPAHQDGPILISSVTQDPAASRSAEGREKCHKDGDATYCVKTKRRTDLVAKIDPNKPQLGRALRAATYDQRFDGPVDQIGVVGTFTRTEACVAPEEVTLSTLDTDGIWSKSVFLVRAAVQLDAKSRKMTQSVKIEKTSFDGAVSAVEFEVFPYCVGPQLGCWQDKKFSWDGPTLWTSAVQPTPDDHSITGTMPMEWVSQFTGEDTKDSLNSEQLEMSWSYTAKVVTVDKSHTFEEEDTGLAPLKARCDSVYATPGCVFPDYRPGYVFNSRKYPEAAAHAWLYQNKLPGHWGAFDHPLKFLPDKVPNGKAGDRNEYGRDPDKNRQVICGSNSGWDPHPDAAKGLVEGKTDKINCDEMAFASTYQSGGMPANMKGTNPVGSGAECLQTYATRLGANGGGAWKFYSDERKHVPTWNEECGRSAISGWMNSGSAAALPGFNSKYRILDQDEFWVQVPGFESCDPSRDTVKCSMS
ncbi:hypothetical protein [Streptomyces sp. NPDC001843]|uniref:hypothetical protein n=1 Tax=Streptomyces sp. NPDC001843 TaxID=3364617 RepID=UPI0036A3F3FD